MEELIMKDDKRIEPTNDGEGVIEQRAGEKERPTNDGKGMEGNDKNKKFFGARALEEDEKE